MENEKLRPTVFQPLPTSQNLPLPQEILQTAKLGSSWSNSDLGSGSKKEDMPVPLAVKEKFIYDPENGGGRRRRDRVLKQPRNYDIDKLEYDESSILSFNERLGLHEPPSRQLSPNPFEIAKDLNEEDIQMKMNQVSIEEEQQPLIDESLF